MTKKSFYIIWAVIIIIAVITNVFILKELTLFSVLMLNTSMFLCVISLIFSTREMIIDVYQMLEKKENIED